MSYDPSPGEKHPELYPTPPREQYQKYGEQKGWVYDSGTDHYWTEYSKEGQAAAEVNRKFAEGKTGADLAPSGPKQPGLGSILGPVAAGAGVLAGTQALVQDPKGVIGGIAEAVKNPGGLIGLGEAAAPVATTAVPAAITPTVAGGLAPATPTLLSGTPVAGEAPGMFGLGGLGGVGALPAAAIGAGIGLIGKGAYDQFQGKPTQGLMDWAARGSLDIATGGLAEVARALFANKHQWKQEKNKLNSLSEQGVYIPQGLIAGMPTHAQGKNELIRHDLPNDFVGTDNQGAWVNNKFAQSRNVADLMPTDIVNYSAFAEHDPEWFHKSNEERLTLAKQTLDAGAVKEHHGTISVDWNKLNQPQQAQSQASTASSTPAATPNAQGNTRVSPGIYKDTQGRTFRSATGRSR